MAQSELERIAIEQRQQLLTSNVFNNFDINNNYSATHTRALSDDETPIQGKGTGVNFDTYNGGGSYDRFGNPSIPGSGRLGNTVINQYDDQNGYVTPDTTGNIGQAVIE